MQALRLAQLALDAGEFELQVAVTGAAVVACGPRGEHLAGQGELHLRQAMALQVGLCLRKLGLVRANCLRERGLGAVARDQLLETGAALGARGLQLRQLRAGGVEGLALRE